LSGQRDHRPRRPVVGRKISPGRRAVEEVEDTLAYFIASPEQARRDSDLALDDVKSHAITAQAQCAAPVALTFKGDVLWAMSDAVVHAYVEGHIPPGAWRPEGS
jgi:pyrroloquinoline-quinone synthase